MHFFIKILKSIRFLGVLSIRTLLKMNGKKGELFMKTVLKQITTKIHRKEVEDDE